MRIGILTHPPKHNYGGILQAWALQTVLEGMGHEVDVFVPARDYCEFFQLLFLWSKRSVLKLLGKLDVPVLYEYYQYRAIWKKSRLIQKFTRRKIHLCGVSGLNLIPSKKYDAIIVGSDQVWRKRYMWGTWQCVVPADMFLSSIADAGLIRVAYAASLGIGEWEYDEDETALISAALNRFNAVSVREKSAVEILHEATGIEAEFVLDPTMLIPAEQYCRLAGCEVHSGGGLVSYILDPTDDKTMMIENIRKTKGYVHRELERYGDEAKIGIEDWVAGFASADMIVTDSFHGCVFSIIFNKPLLFVINETRGNARFDSLVQVFGLERNMVKDIRNVDLSRDFKLPSDIQSCMDVMKEKSMVFLKSALSGRNKMN